MIYNILVVNMIWKNKPCKTYSKVQITIPRTGVISFRKKMKIQNWKM